MRTPPLRRAFSTPPAGLSPRITALLRRADAAADVAADVAAAPSPDAAHARAADAPSDAHGHAPAAARAELVARNSAALAELRSMLRGTAAAGAPRGAERRAGAAAADASEECDPDTAAAVLLRDVRGVTARARRGAQTSVLAEQAALVMARHGLGEAGAARLVASESPPPSASGAALRARRDAVWQNIVARGTECGALGALLRGFFRDHARQMDADELSELETILLPHHHPGGCVSTEALQAYVARAAAPPAHLAGLPAFRLLTQYCRFWSGEGHQPGGEYV